MRELLVNLSPSSELEEDVAFGEAPEELGFAAVVNDQPIAHSIQRIFETLGHALPPDLSVYQRFNLWLVPHTAKVVRRSGSAIVGRVGILVEYDTGGKTCSVQTLLPAPVFVETLRASGEFGLKGTFSAFGEASQAVDLSVPAAGALAFAGLALRPGVRVGVEGEGKLQGNLSVGVQFEARVLTPYISASGLRSSKPEWSFERHNEPLFNRDIETWAVIALPRRVSALRYKLKVTLGINPSWIRPIKYRESEWVEVECKLDA